MTSFRLRSRGIWDQNLNRDSSCDPKRTRHLKNRILQDVDSGQSILQKYRIGPGMGGSERGTPVMLHQMKVREGFFLQILASRRER